MSTGLPSITVEACDIKHIFSRGKSNQNKYRKINNIVTVIKMPVYNQFVA
jgi:hypothetical protein